MRTIVLIACCKTKLTAPAPARELYQGALFKKCLSYAARLRPDDVFVLSAEHGLIAMDDVIAPYEKTLNRMGRAERMQWSVQVLDQLSRVADFGRDRFVVLASARYRESLMPKLANTAVPLQGLGIGRQLQWLDRELEHG